MSVGKCLCVPCNALQLRSWNEKIRKSAGASSNAMCLHHKAFTLGFPPATCAGILSYRTPMNLSRESRKRLHSFFQLLAVVLVSLGLWAVFEVSAVLSIAPTVHFLLLPEGESVLKRVELGARSSRKGVCAHRNLLKFQLSNCLEALLPGEHPVSARASALPSPRICNKK